MTAAEALQHPWLTQSAEAYQQQQQQQMQEQQQQPQDQGPQDMEGVAPHDLLPSMMTHIKASTRKFRKAGLAVQAMNALRKRHEDLREVHPEEVSHVLHRADEDMV
jgi:calcium/calmodulin-dependent protein kinase I